MCHYLPSRNFPVSVCKTKKHIHVYNRHFFANESFILTSQLSLKWCDPERCSIIAGSKMGTGSKPSGTPIILKQISEHLTTAYFRTIQIEYLAVDIIPAWWSDRGIRLNIIFQVHLVAVGIKWYPCEVLIYLPQLICLWERPLDPICHR